MEGETLGLGIPSHGPYSLRRRAQPAAASPTASGSSKRKKGKKRKSASVLEEVVEGASSNSAALAETPADAEPTITAEHAASSSENNVQESITILPLALETPPPTSRKSSKKKKKENNVVPLPDTICPPTPPSPKKLSPRSDSLPPTPVLPSPSGGNTPETLERSSSSGLLSTFRSSTPPVLLAKTNSSLRINNDFSGAADPVGQSYCSEDSNEKPTTSAAASGNSLGPIEARIGFMTARGGRVENQDAYKLHIESTPFIFALCDGHGPKGRVAADEACKAIVSTIRRSFRQASTAPVVALTPPSSPLCIVPLPALTPTNSSGDLQDSALPSTTPSTPSSSSSSSSSAAVPTRPVEKFIHQSFSVAHEKIISQCLRSQLDYGTTACAAVIEGDLLTAGWVGDSRVIIYSPQEASQTSSSSSTSSGESSSTSSTNLPADQPPSANGHSNGRGSEHVVPHTRLQALQITDDHVPTREDERARILLSGGRVVERKARQVLQRIPQPAAPPPAGVPSDPSNLAPSSSSSSSSSTTTTSSSGSFHSELGSFYDPMVTDSLPPPPLAAPPALPAAPPSTWRVIPSEKDYSSSQIREASLALNISRALGHVVLSRYGVSPTPDIKSVTLRNGDIVMLCSDGLWGEVSNEDIGELIGKHLDKDLNKVCSVLVKEAENKSRLRGFVADNITVVLYAHQSCTPGSS